MDQRGHLRRVHLPIGIYFNYNVGALLDRVTHAGEERAADALVLVVHQRDHARIAAAAGECHGGTVGATVVHHNDQFDLGADRCNDRQDRGCRPVRWDDDAIHRNNRLHGTKPLMARAPAGTLAGAP